MLRSRSTLFVAGAMTGGGIATSTARYLAPTALPTVNVFLNVPALPARFTETSNVPLVPPSSVQGSVGTFATVQPQDVLTALMMIGTEEMFVRVKVKFAVASPGLAEYFLVSASATRFVGFGGGATTVKGFGITGTGVAGGAALGTGVWACAVAGCGWTACGAG